MTLPLEPVNADASVQRNFNQIALQFPLGLQSLGSNAPAQAGLTGGGVVRSGAVNIATAQSTTSTSYVVMATPDRVSSVVLPTNGLLVVWYQALWQNTVASNGRAAIFLGANQVKRHPIGGGGGVPIVQEAVGNSTVNIDAPLATDPLTGLATQNATTNATEVTTGQLIGGPGPVVGSSVGSGLACIFAAAGTYDVGVQFKNVAAGTLTVKSRHLWVRAYSFS